MRAVLYDVDWQLLRINTLKDRQAEGGWSTMTGTCENLNSLFYYMTENDREYAVRTYRVHNMLNAVVMGYHGARALGEDTDDLIDRVRKFKTDFDTDEYDKVGVQLMADKWDWYKVARDLRILHTGDAWAFEYIQKNLTVRARNGSDKTRPELHKFLGLMREISPLTGR